MLKPREQEEGLAEFVANHPVTKVFGGPLQCIERVIVGLEFFRIAGHNAKPLQATQDIVNGLWDDIGYLPKTPDGGYYHEEGSEEPLVWHEHWALGVGRRVGDIFLNGGTLVTRKAWVARLDGANGAQVDRTFQLKARDYTRLLQREFAHQKQALGAAYPNVPEELIHPDRLAQLAK